MSKCILAVGNAFDGLVCYGPFDHLADAISWAECNPVAELSDLSWEVVPLERTKEEGEETVYYTVIANLGPVPCCIGKFDDKDEAKQWAEKKYGSDGVIWKVAIFSEDVSDE